MPELPEVTTIVNALVKAGLPGLKIAKAEFLVPAQVAPMSLEEAAKSLEGLKIISLARRAKYLVFELEGGLFLIAHLRMSGHFVFINSKDERGRFERARITLSDGRALRYDDIRKFGRFMLVRNKFEVLGKLGPEPLDASFTGQVLYSLLQKDRKLRTSLKAWLLDQTKVAGLGNIYVDESLWLAFLHPERKLASITKNEAEALADAIKAALKKGIANSGTSLGRTQGNFIKLDGLHGANQNTLNVFQQTGRPCPRCATPIKKKVVAQRGTHFCPNCQKQEQAHEH